MPLFFSCCRGIWRSEFLRSEGAGKTSKSLSFPNAPDWVEGRLLSGIQLFGTPRKRGNPGNPDKLGLDPRPFDGLLRVVVSKVEPR